MEDRYDRVASALHWAIAALVLANWPLGFFGEAAEERLGLNLVPIHKSIGLTVLALSLLRLAWRLLHRPPAFIAMEAWRARAARLAHAALYVLMIAMPLTGWLRVSPGKYPLTWFGLFEVPKWPIERGSAEAAAASQAHETFAFLFLALIGLHVVAALHHQFVLRDRLLARMSWARAARDIP